MQKDIIKCKHCDSKKQRSFLLSCDGRPQYFFNCFSCGTINYFKFPSYIPEKQYAKYVEKKYNVKGVW